MLAGWLGQVFPAGSAVFGSWVLCYDDRLNSLTAPSGFLASRQQVSATASLICLLLCYLLASRAKHGLLVSASQHPPKLLGQHGDESSMLLGAGGRMSFALFDPSRLIGQCWLLAWNAAGVSLLCTHTRYS